MPNTRLTEAFSNNAIMLQVLDSIKDYAVFTLNPEGYVTTWNEGARRIKEYEAHEIIGQYYGMLYTKEDQESGHPKANLENTVKQGHFYEERERVRKSGQIFFATVNINPIYDEAGQLSGFIKVVGDVSMRKLMEEELAQYREELEKKVLKRTAQLQQANQELETFCYSIAHDLRGPIRGIIGKCRIAQEDYASHLPAEAHDHLDSLCDTSKRLSDLVDDLLEFARLGQHHVKRQDIDVTAVARRVAEEITPYCHSGSAKLVVEEGMQAHADPQLVEFVLHNLLENACKYSTRHVNVHVGSSNIAGDTVFYVKDDGIGFDMDYYDKLFKPFERLHRDPKTDGTGIGLANVKRIVTRHGGRVWATGSPGDGATFFFTLSGGPDQHTRLEEIYQPYPKPLLACEGPDC
jgi:PAS domain S-box-containing protein